jgi:hypothetical protein
VLCARARVCMFRAACAASWAPPPAPRCHQTSAARTPLVTAPPAWVPTLLVPMLEVCCRLVPCLLHAPALPTSNTDKCAVCTKDTAVEPPLPPSPPPPPPGGCGGVGAFLHAWPRCPAMAWVRVWCMCRTGQPCAARVPVDCSHGLHCMLSGRWGLPRLRPLAPQVLRALSLWTTLILTGCSVAPLAALFAAGGLCLIALSHVCHPVSRAPPCRRCPLTKR